MRITVLCTDLGIRFPGDRAAALRLQGLAAALAAEGHAVQLVGAAGGEPPTRLLSGLTDLVLLDHPARGEGHERERRQIDFVEQVVEDALPRVRAFDPDAVYERLSLFGDAGVRITSTLRRPVLAVEVGALLTSGSLQRRGLQYASLAKVRQQHTLDGAALRLTSSPRLAASITSASPGAPTVVLPHGVDVDAFSGVPDVSAARARLGVGPDDLLAVLVGALRNGPGIESAIDAVAMAGPTTRLAIVGGGDLRLELERRAMRLGVGHRVHFLGPKAHHEVPALLAAADCAVAPYPELLDLSFSPLRLYEYLAAGVPVVASDVGQVRDALGWGRWGSLVPPGDVPSLARAILASRSGTSLARAAAGRNHAMNHHGWRERARDVGAHLQLAFDQGGWAALAH